MSTKYKLRITGECKQNMKLCKRRGLIMKLADFKALMQIA